MRESKIHTIDSYVYTVQQLGAKQGRIVLARMLRVIGPAAEAQDSVAKLAASLTDDEVNYLCDTFSKATQVSKSEDLSRSVALSDVFDDHFAGRYGAMVKWLWAALDTNYASFLGDLGLAGALDAAKAAMTPKPSILSSPTTPSGVSSSPASAS